MGPTAFTQLAERYWRTYRPSALARIPEQERAPFFEAIGQETHQLAEDLTWQILDQASTGQDPETIAARGQMARLRAEEQALNELVYLEKEPGTEDREMPRTGR